MLRRRRVLTQFHYGAANVDGRGLTGHIWLTDGNEPVVGGDSAHHYIKLLDWG
jgi:hypothetical protein